MEIPTLCCKFECLVLNMENVIAQVQVTVGPPLNGLGPLGNISIYPITFATVISSTIGLLTVVAFIWFTFVLFAGAIGIIGSGGDKSKFEAARQKITTGLIGVVIVVAAIFILDFTTSVLGLINPLNILGVINILSP